MRKRKTIETDADSSWSITEDYKGNEKSRERMTHKERVQRDNRIMVELLLDIRDLMKREININ